MTKQELKQEAEVWLCNNLHSASEEDFIKAMVDIAEPREKRIAELEQKLEQIKNEKFEKALSQIKHDREVVIEYNERLQKENAELTDELRTLRESIKDYGAGCYENGLRNGKRKLEEQIEKMKCCYNCAKWNDGECEESPKSKTFFCADFKCDNWEMFK